MLAVPNDYIQHVVLVHVNDSETDSFQPEINLIQLKCKQFREV